MTITKQVLLASALALAIAAPAAAQQSHGAKFLTEQNARQQVASDVIGMEVTGTDGKRFGKITDLLLDQHHNLQGVVMSVGGFLGLGAKKIALGWNDITFEHGDHPHAVLAMSEEDLANAPDFKSLADIRRDKEDQERRDKMRQSSTTSGGGFGGLPARRDANP
jgi:sporulation protein YlmC with PRC-barrel domain